MNADQPSPQPASQALPQFSPGELSMLTCAILTYVSQLHSIEPAQANDALNQIQAAMDKSGAPHERYTCWADYVLVAESLASRMVALDSVKH